MKAHLTLFFALLLLCTGVALAKTPDGLPPSVETVCDDEVGAAFGLCNAYCEAMDCESEAPHASPVACGRVREHFLRITGRNLACEAQPCPCTSIPGFNEILANAITCRDSSFSVVLSTVDPLDVPRATVFFEGACAYNPGGEVPPTILDLTSEEVEVCTQLFRDTIANLGLTCEVPE